MADKTIGDLTATTALADADLLEIQNAGGNSRKITASDARLYLGSASLIEEHIFAGSTSSKSFSPPSTFRDLELIIVGRTTDTTSQPVVITVNGLTTAIYDLQRHYVFGTSAAGDQTLGGNNLQPCTLPGTGVSAGDIGGGRYDFIDYAGTTFNKLIMGHARMPQSTTTHNGYNMQFTAQVRLTAAITSITIALVAGNFVAGSRATLRGKI